MAKLENVQAILGAAFKQFGIEEKVKKYGFVLHWSEIVGSEIASRTKPEALVNGRLRVRVNDSVWAQELSFYKETILARLKKYLEPGERVDDLYFHCG